MIQFPRPGRFSRNGVSLRSLPQILALAGLTGALGWWALNLYSTSGRPDPAREAAVELAKAALTRGLRHDSSGVAALSQGTEPAIWLQKAMQSDSTLVASWLNGDPVVLDARRNDTTYVYWWTKSSKQRCPDGGVLEAGVTEDSEGLRLASLSSTCGS